MSRIAKVRLELDSRPESVALVRAALSGVAEWRELDPELVNDLKTAVSEACNNVIVHAYDEDERPGPLWVDVDADGTGVTATVRDHGVGFQAVAAREDGMGVGLAVISALAARAEFAAPPDGGTEVRMWFPAGPADTRPLAHFDGPHHVGRLEDPRDSTSPPLELSGDVRVTVSPVSLTTPVLGRLARAMAAGARFSFDRFSDVYLVADTLGAQAQRSAASDRISFGLLGSTKRLELLAGPFTGGTGARLQRPAGDEELFDSPLTLLADEITAAGDERAETLRVVLRDGAERARRERDDY